MINTKWSYQTFFYCEQCRRLKPRVARANRAKLHVEGTIVCSHRLCDVVGDVVRDVCEMLREVFCVRMLCDVCVIRVRCACDVV